LDFNSAGEVIYYATVQSGKVYRQGFFRHDGAMSEVIAMEESSTPAGGVYNGFGIHQLNSKGEVAHIALLSGAPAEGILTYNQTGGTVLALSGTPAPGGGLYHDFQDLQLNDSGQVAFLATLNDGSLSEGVFLNDGATTTVVARLNTVAPGGTAYNGEMGTPQLNALGQIAFQAGLAGGQSTSGIFRYDGNMGRAIALAETPAPAGGSYVSFSTPELNANGKVAYRAKLSDGPSTHGVFLYDGSENIVIALQGDLAPDTTANFYNLDRITINDAGLVALRAELAGDGVTSANNTGIWFGTDSSDLTLLVREGDTLFVNGANRTVDNLLTYFPLSLTNSALAWNASFTDGTSAIIVSTFLTVPEPRLAAILSSLTLGAITITARQRQVKIRLC
jgi:hypothetical protein